MPRCVASVCSSSSSTRAELDNDAGLEQMGGVDQGQSEGDVLLDEHHRDAAVGDRLEHGVELELGDRRQPRAGLVDEHQRRLVDERPAHRQRGLLPAGHRPGQLRAPFAQHREAVVDAVERGGVAAAVPAAQGVGAEPQVLLDGQPGEHLAALWDVAHARRHALLRRPSGDVLALQQDASRPGRDDAGEGLHGHALAGTVETEDAGDAAGRDRERDAVQHRGGAEAGGHVLHLQQRLAHAKTSWAGAVPR